MLSFNLQVFDPASYPEDHLNVWGLNHLEVLLGHYGERKHTADGPADPLVNADAARGEFLMFKRLVSEHLGEDKDGHFHTYRAEELFVKIFSGPNRHNRRIFPGRLFLFHRSTLLKK